MKTTEKTFYHLETMPQDTCWPGEKTEVKLQEQVVTKY